MNLDLNFDISVPIDKQELNAVVYSLSTNIAKLCDITKTIDTNIKQDAIPCDVVDMTLLFEEKCRIIENIKEEVQNSETNLPGTYGEILVNIYKMLVNENKQQIEMLQYLTNDVQIRQENLDKMKHRLQLLKLAEKSNGIGSLPIPEMLDIKMLHNNTAKKLIEMRANLHKVLEISFRQTNIKELVEDLTHAFFKGGEDKYIDVSEKYSVTDINTLKQASLIVMDPYNNMRIKIDDICDV